MFLQHLEYLADKTLKTCHHHYIALSSGCLPFGRCHGTVACNMFPAYKSWGGSSVFVKQFATALRRYGFRLVFDVKKKIDVILIIDPREDLLNKSFGMQDILTYRKNNPGVKIIHRINECDQRKSTNFIDEILLEANSVADHTVFISEWLKEYFQARWFAESRSNSTIYNGADVSVFHPVGSTPFRADGPLRLVTHHWSANPMKGFPVYKMIDDMIAEGKILDTELWIIGQWPADIQWRAARTFGPTSGVKLAGLLRQCHVYITASLWEPCGMHHVEGVQCGLPLLYHEDGGGIVEAGKKYGIPFREDTIVEAVTAMKSNYQKMREKVFTHMPDGSRMASDYVRIVQRLMAES